MCVKLWAIGCRNLGNFWGALLETHDNCPRKFFYKKILQHKSFQKEVLKAKNGISFKCSLPVKTITSACVMVAFYGFIIIRFCEETDSSPVVSWEARMGSARRMGRKKEGRRLADPVFNMADSLMADFIQNGNFENRPFHVAYLSSKLPCPHISPCFNRRTCSCRSHKIDRFVFI